MLRRWEFQHQSALFRPSLDGQQRLQSLFVALYGTYDNAELHFDVLSGRSGDDFSQQRYVFAFGSPTQMKERNSRSKKETTNPSSKTGDFLEYMISVSTLFQLGTTSRQKLRKQLVKDLALTEEDELRVESNLSRFDEVLTKNENLLKASVIDENLPSDSAERKTEADVLEIFVRINRQGTPLSRSDLIFSILKLRWKESAQALPDFVRGINEGNAFRLDPDFVIRCLFAVSDLGTRFDLELLRSQSKVDLMRNNFARCCDAIRSTLDFVITKCWCQSSSLIGGNATLVPLVYYVFGQQKFQVPNNQVERLRKALFLLGFAQPFSRYADSRLGAFLRQELRPLAIAKDTKFPLEQLVSWIKYWERITEFGEDLVRGNHRLALHILQRNTGTKTHFAGNAPEIDHIFPRATLRSQGTDPAKIEHFANYWILAKGKNGNKSDKHPADYFKDVSNEELKRALIYRKLLDYRRYTTFLKKRSAAILKAITQETSLSDADFQTDEVD
jgi:5-methylcytosine-specific restriction endonuclease McrA